MKRRIKIQHDPQKKWDEAFWTIPGWNPEKIKAAKVMVVGAGALGNEVIKNLTLLNIGHILIVDFDVVEFKNLAKSILFRKEDKGQRKSEAIVKNLKDVNDEVKVQSINGDIGVDVGLGVFRRMDVVIGCLDNRLARLNINRNCFRVNKTWVDGALENLAGTFSVYSSGITCYECGLSEDAKEIIQFRMGCPDIAKRNASAGSIATTPLSASVIGAFQVQEALKVIFGNEENSILGEAFRYNGMNNFFLKYKLSNLKEDCESHELYEDIIEAKELSHENTVREVLDWIQNYFKTKDPKFLVKEDIVLEAVTTKSGKKCKTAIYKNYLFEAEEVKKIEIQPDEELHILDSTWIVDRAFPFPNKTLKDIKIPFLEILKVEAKDDIFYVELTGDENKLQFK